jgi:hypothetical protein
MGVKLGLLTSQKNKRSVLHAFNKDADYKVYPAKVISERDRPAFFKLFSSGDYFY